MRKLCGMFFGLVLFLGVAADSSRAQFKNGSQATELNLPRISQRAQVMQRVGLTDITVVYHAPLAGGRDLFGKVVPYGKVWRAGANENTTISFTDDVSVEGHPLPAGTYGLHTIPNADEWTIIFSKNSTSWGSFSYDEKEDALRVNVKPTTAENRDSLAYTFDDIKPESTAVTLRWGKVAVPFHVSVDVNAITERSIRNQLRNVGGFTWAGFDEAGNWSLDNNYKLDEGLKWEETSIQNEERFDNLETKSRILDAMGKKQEAPTFSKKPSSKPTPSSCMFTRADFSARNSRTRRLNSTAEDAKKYPNHWITHVGTARIASASGNFDEAVKEMKIAVAGTSGRTANLPSGPAEAPRSQGRHQQVAGN